MGQAIQKHILHPAGLIMLPFWQHISALGRVVLPTKQLLLFFRSYVKEYCCMGSGYILVVLKAILQVVGMIYVSVLRWRSGVPYPRTTIPCRHILHKGQLETLHVQNFSNYVVTLKHCKKNISIFHVFLVWMGKSIPRDGFSHPHQEHMIDTFSCIFYFI